MTENTTKVSHLEATILELNMRISTLKNEKTVVETEKSQFAQKAAHYESSLQELTLKAQGFKRDATTSVQDRVRLQHLEGSNAELTTRLLAITNEKTFLEGENTQLKKQVVRLE